MTLFFRPKNKTDCNVCREVRPLKKMCPVYITTLHLKMILHFWRFRGSGVFFHWYDSKVYSDPEFFILAKVSPMALIDIFFKLCLFDDSAQKRLFMRNYTRKCNYENTMKCQFPNLET